MMLGLAGVWGVIEGGLVIADPRFYTADAALVFSNLNAWGWIVMVLGAVQLVAALAILSGSEVARWFGIFVAGVNAIGQLFFVTRSRSGHWPRSRSTC